MGSIYLSLANWCLCHIMPSRLRSQLWNTTHTKASPWKVIEIVECDADRGGIDAGWSPGIESVAWPSMWAWASSLIALSRCRSRLASRSSRNGHLRASRHRRVVSVEIIFYRFGEFILRIRAR